jgi:Spy/CpxP family protein refolding chaperone
MKQYFKILFFSIIFLTGSVAFAQDRSENIEAAKVAYLTDKLELSPDQAQKFWPVYNEYENKRRELMRNYRGGYKRNLEEMSEQEAKARIDEMFETKEKELALEKEYVTKYQRVLSQKQIIHLYRAEHEFTKLLLKRLDNRKTATK